MVGKPPYRNPFFRLVGFVMRRIPIERKYWKEGVLWKTDLLSLKPDLAETTGCSFDWGEGNDVQSIARHPETSGKHPVHARRVEAGHRCFCARKDGKVLAFNWVSFDSGWVNFGKDGELSFFPLPKRSVFTDDLYTYTDARRQGIGALLKARQFASLRSMGIDTAYNYVLLSNSASLGLFLKLGSVPEALVYCLCLGNYRRAFTGTGGETRRLKYWAQSLREPLRIADHFEEMAPPNEQIVPGRYPALRGIQYETKTALQEYPRRKGHDIKKGADAL